VMGLFVACSIFLDGRIGPEPDSRAGGEGDEGERGVRAQEGDRGDGSGPGKEFL
jgi:hypothetical protein